MKQTYSEKDFRQSAPFSKYLASSGWKTDRLSDGTYVYVFHLPLLGSVIRIPRPKSGLPLEELNPLAKKHQAVLIKLEPDTTSDAKLIHQLNKNGFRFDSWSIEPTKTLIINLAQSENKLFADLKPKWRQYVRFAQKNGVAIQKSEDINTFVNLWQQNAKRKKFAIEKSAATKVLWQEFKAKKSADLLFAKVDGQPIAASFLIFSDKTCHFWHMAYNGKYENLRPLYLLVWKSILFAKSKGCQEFDFEGIEDPRLPYTRKFQPTFFKKGFGGLEKPFLGSYIKITNPVYLLPYHLVGKLKPDFFRWFYKKFYG